MLHTCYHIIPNNNNHEYVRSIKEARTRIARLKTNGQNHLKIFQIFTEEDFDVDAIRLKEVEIDLPELNS